MKAHKIAELFPMLGETEINELANDIKENGLMVPIITYEDCILDGRNRYAACKIADVEPVMKEYEGESPLEYVLSLNLHRRHLDATQKAVLGVRMLPIMEEEARKKQVEAGIITQSKKKQLVTNLSQAEINIENAQKTMVTNSSPLFSKNDNKKSRDKVAAIVGVGTSYISEVKKITEEHPQYTEQMFRGDITLQEVKKELKEARNQAYREKEKQKKDVSNIVEVEIKLYNNDISDAPIDDNSLDAIITDPPYPKEFLHCWDKLAEFASKKLKDGGILLAMSGQSYLPYVFNAMNVKGLNYYWTNCIKLTVSPNLHTKRLCTHWKPVLFYVKGEYNKTFQKSDVFADIEYKQTVEGQEYHMWGQSLPLMKQMIQDYTYATDLVCDPFLGGGTTGVACKELKRKFIGIELDNDTYNIAKGRIL